jgi:DNA-binding XRE family transcriptional regulator
MPHTRVLLVNSWVSVRLTIEGAISPRRRRMIALGLVRSLAPALRQMLHVSIEHDDIARARDWYEHERPLSLRNALVIHGPDRSLGFRIRAERLGRGWSQAELARRSGVARVQLSRIERSQVAPRIDTLRALDQALRQADAGGQSSAATRKLQLSSERRNSVTLGWLAQRDR